MPQNSFQADTGTGVLIGWESGDGPPLLLLHGGPGLSDYMTMLGPETAGWRAVGYQQRGIAPSATEGPFTDVRHAADAVAVLDAAGLREVVVLGHSWGGYLALRLAVAAPERVAGLVLVDPLGATGPSGGASDLGEALRGRLDAAALAKLSEMAARIGDRMPTDQEGTEQLALLWPGYFAVPAQAPPPPAGLAVSAVANEEGMASVADSLAGGFGDRLAAVRAPAVFVLGEHSPMPVSQGQQTAALLPDAEVVVVEGAGHLPWHERPGCVTSALAAVRGRAGV
jgi:pimeloyl-ACP methyl ester carboxylesterase